MSVVLPHHAVLSPVSSSHHPHSPPRQAVPKLSPPPIPPNQQLKLSQLSKSCGQLDRLVMTIKVLSLVTILVSICLTLASGYAEMTLFVDTLPSSDTTTPVTFHLAPPILYNPSRQFLVTIALCRYTPSALSLTGSLESSTYLYPSGYSPFYFTSAFSALPTVPIRRDNFNAVPTHLKQSCAQSAPSSFEGENLTAYAQFTTTFPSASRHLISQELPAVSTSLHLSFQQNVDADRNINPQIYASVEDLRTHAAFMTQYYSSDPVSGRLFSDTKLDEFPFTLSFTQSPIDDSGKFVINTVTNTNSPTPTPSTSPQQQQDQNQQSSSVFTSTLSPTLMDRLSNMFTLSRDKDDQGGGIQKHQARLIDGLVIPSPVPSIVYEDSLTIYLSTSPSSSGKSLYFSKMGDKTCQLVVAQSSKTIQVDLNIHDNSRRASLSCQYCVEADSPLNDVKFILDCPQLMITYRDYTAFSPSDPITFRLVSAVTNKEGTTRLAVGTWDTTQGHIDQAIPERRGNVIDVWTTKILLLCVLAIVTPIVLIIVLSTISWFRGLQKKKRFRAMLTGIQREEQQKNLLLHPQQPLSDS